MAVTLVRHCPHCKAPSVAMRPIGVIATGQNKSTTVFSCNRCNEVLCVRAINPPNGMQWVMSNATGDFDQTARTSGVSVIDAYPAKETLDAPDHVSDAVRRPFVQGLDNAERGNSDAAASMFRKAIDVATRELDPSTTGKPLAKRIDLLADNGKLTSDLKEWAHLIRLDGNQGAHDDEELSRDEIEQLKEFTRLFLIYTFTLPAQVQARKEEASQA